MLKKKVVVLFGALALVLTSCGGTDVCDCLNMPFEMMEEASELEMGDTEKREALEEKYKAVQEACEPIIEEYEKEMEGKTDEERNQAIEDRYIECGLEDVFNKFNKSSTIINENGTTPCDCAEGLKQMSADYMDAGEDEAKREGLEKKYEKLLEDCEALSEKMGQEEFQKAIKECE